MAKKKAAKKAAQKKTAVSKSQETGLVALDGLDGFDEDAGWENQDNSDIKVPFLNLLQDASPQVKKSSHSRIEGAEGGYFHNSVTNEVYGESFTFIPCLTEHVYVKWRKRTLGGGFVARYQPDDPEIQSYIGKPGKVEMDDEHELQETFYIYALGLDDDGNSTGIIVIAFASTKIKSYKELMTGLRSFTVYNEGRKRRPPLFTHKVTLTSVPEEHQGHSYFNVRAQPAEGTIRESILQPGLNDEDRQLMLEADSYRKLIKAGEAKADYSSGDTYEAEELEPEESEAF